MVFGRYGDRVIEPEIELVFAALLLLRWLGERASSHAVPAWWPAGALEFSVAAVGAGVAATRIARRGLELIREAIF